jgi:peptide/nickel transport system substrate-binding protein
MTILLSNFGIMTTIAQGEPQHGGTIRVATRLGTELPQWTPLQPGGGYWKMNYLARCAFERLMTYDENWNPIPELATDWETPDGGKTWTFHLRDDVYWHDGVKFTSEDVKFYYDLIANRTAPDTYVTVFNRDGLNMINFVEEITTPDDYTVTFHCNSKQPLTILIEMKFSGFISTPKHIFEGTGNVLENPAADAPIGTGPYKFVEHIPGAYVKWERNDNYWDNDKPYADILIEKFYSDATSAVIALEAGDVDYIQDDLGLTPSEFKRLNATEEFVSYSFTYGNSIQLDINHHPENIAKVPALGDPKVRTAMSHAIDRESIVKYVFEGMTKPNSHYFARATPSWRASDIPDYHAYDPELAEEMLDEAGYPRKADGYRFDMGQIVSYETYINAAEVIVENFDDVGIKCEIRTMETAAIVDSLEKSMQNVPGVSGLLLGEKKDPPRWMKNELHTDAIIGGSLGLEDNHIHYSNEEMDKITDEIQEAITEEDINEVAQKADKLFYEQVPILVICDRFKGIVWDAKLQSMPGAALPQAYFTKHGDMWFKTEETTEPTPSLPEETEEQISQLVTTTENIQNQIDTINSQIESLNTKIDTIEVPTTTPSIISYLAIILSIVAIVTAYYFGTKK